MCKYNEREIWDSIGILGARYMHLYPRHKGGEEVGLFVNGGGDLLRHGVTQGHELIDLDRNAMLLGQRREWARNDGILE